MEDGEKWHRLYNRDKEYGKIFIGYSFKDHSAEEDLRLAREAGEGEDRIAELEEIVAKEKEIREKMDIEVKKLYTEATEKEKERLEALKEEIKGKLGEEIKEIYTESKEKAEEKAEAEEAEKEKQRIAEEAAAKAE